jgi:hypothetical protein
MSQKYHFTKYPEPIEAEMDAVDGLAMVYFGAGIVNPMGPTLSLLIGDHIRNPRETQNLFQVIFNPFSQSCYKVGEVNVGDEWQPATDLAPFYDLSWGCCPTFLIPSAAYSEKAGQSIFSEFLQTFEDGTKTLKKVKKHPGDPWTRVKGEVDGTVGMLEKIRMGIFKESNLDGTLSPTQAAELARLQLDPKNLLEEFRAFMFAWEGSQNFLRIPGLSKDQFLKTFSRLAMTARLPFMKNIFDNPEILED